MKKLGMIINDDQGKKKIISDFYDSTQEFSHWNDQSLYFDKIDDTCIPLGINGESLLFNQ